MRFFYSLVFIYFLGCSGSRQPDSNLTLSLQKSVVLDSLSSGSGLVFTARGIFAVSDNMNGFFMIDTTILAYTFTGFDSVPSHIQTKDIKEDFENATAYEYQGKEWMLAFGSGSVQKSREKILLVPVDNAPQFRIIDAVNLYGALKKALGISTNQLNLEACFSSRDSLYLLNRGTNQSIAMNKKEFSDALASNFSQSPAMRVQQYKLPVIDGYNAAFSGACFYEEDRFIFSATVEKTSNWVDDGEVAGSFIGIGNVNGTIEKVVPLLDRNHQMIKEKIESIEWMRSGSDKSILYALSDNDNGKSTWFVIECTGIN